MSGAFPASVPGFDWKSRAFARVFSASPCSGGNALLGPLVKINSDHLKPLPLGLLNFVDLNSANWPLLMAASLISILPLIVLFLFGQRFFVSGVRLGGVKG